MNIYEQYGRLVEQYQAECESHAQTVNVLRRLKQGDITLDMLMVTDENKWAISQSETLEAELPVN